MENEKRTIENWQREETSAGQDEKEMAKMGYEELDRERKTRGDDIAERLLCFAARIIKLANALPKTETGKHVGVQIVRSGTSSGANYEEARGAESRKDFTHKLGIALKELRETRYWLKIIVRAGLAPLARMKDLTTEADELCRIIGKSIVTARRQ